MREEKRVTTSTLYKGWRLDKFLATVLAPVSRSRVQTLIGQGYVFGELGPVTEPDCQVQVGKTYRIFFPPLEDVAIRGETIPLDIIFEDEDILILNKPPGLVVHPAPGHRDGTLVNALIAYCGDSLSGISGQKRPGIVHRLDQGTSGLMVVAKHDHAHGHLSHQLATRSMTRLYWAFVWGTPVPLEGWIHGRIGRHPVHRQKMAVLQRGGKLASTFYKVKTVYKNQASLIVCQLQTGRTHQIRVHLSQKGNSVIGDLMYGRGGLGKDCSWVPTRQALHAKILHLIHPRTQEHLVFETALPEDLLVLQKALESL